MPMPTANTGKARLPPEDLRNVKSTAINATPMATLVKI